MYRLSETMVYRRRARIGDWSSSFWTRRASSGPDEHQLEPVEHQMERSSIFWTQKIWKPKLRS